MFNIFNKKGQGATEYLIIVAVVIIIALIAVAALGGIPGIGSGAKNRAAATYWQTSDIGIPVYSAAAGTDDINISVRNNLRDGISSLTISVDGNSMTCVATSLNAGQETKCSHESGADGCSAAGAFTYGVSVTYTNDKTGKSYTFTGDGHDLEGVCAT